MHNRHTIRYHQPRCDWLMVASWLACLALCLGLYAGAAWLFFH